MKLTMKKNIYIFVVAFIFISALLFSCGNGGNTGDDSFTIRYDANGAEAGTAPIAQIGNKDSFVSLQTNTGSLNKSGYLFDGWNTKADGSGTDYVPGASYKLNDDIKLYAKWSAIFNFLIVNPGSPSPSLDGIQETQGFSYLKITGLTEKGLVLSDITILGTIDGYTVSAIGSSAFQDCTNIIKMRIPETVRDIGDNAFSGCFNLSAVTMQGTEPPSLGTDAFEGCVLLVVSVPGSAASTYNSNPNWSAIDIFAPGMCCVIYNGNGSDGGVVPSKQVGIAGTTFIIYGNNGNLTRSNFSFNGWNTKADGTGDDYNIGAPYSGSEDIILYAKWKAKEYSIIINNLVNGKIITNQPLISNRQTGIWGETIKLYVLPDPYYELDSITVIKADGGLLDVETKENGYEYIFTMPSEIVNISATFKSFTPEYIELGDLKIGDIVLGNGKFVSFEKFCLNSRNYIAISKPQGVVAYKGSTGNYGVSGKVYMVGLREEFATIWSTGKAIKFNTSFTSGEDNWAIIKAADAEGAADASNIYPAFHYANTYSAIGFSDWFLPSLEELYQIYKNKEVIMQTMEKLSHYGFANVDTLIYNKQIGSSAAGFYWSSSQSDIPPNYLPEFYAEGVRFDDGTKNYKYKREIYKVLVCHVLN